MSKKRFEKLRRANNTISVFDNKTDSILKINDIVYTLNRYEERCILLERALTYWTKKFEESTETFQIKE